MKDYPLNSRLIQHKCANDINDAVLEMRVIPSQDDGKREKQYLENNVTKCKGHD